MANYKRCKRQFLGIANIHVMRQSMKRVARLAHLAEYIWPPPNHYIYIYIYFYNLNILYIYNSILQNKQAKQSGNRH